jgi:hypothetical protein
MIQILCTRRSIKYIVQKCSVRDITTDPHSTWLVMKMIEFVHDHGPRTVDFVLDGITDYAFSLWAALYMYTNDFTK